MTYLSPSNCQNLIFKPSMKCIDWAGIQSTEAMHSRMTFSRSNTALSWLDMPTKMRKLKNAYVALCHATPGFESIEILIDIFKKCTSIFSVFASSIEIANQEKMITLTTCQISVLSSMGFLGSLALFLKHTSQLRKNFNQILSSKIWGGHFNFALLKLTGRICCILTGGLGMFAFAFGHMQTTWIFLWLSSAALSVSIAKFYFKQFSCFK